MLAEEGLDRECALPKFKVRYKTPVRVKTLKEYENEKNEDEFDFKEKETKRKTKIVLCDSTDEILFISDDEDRSQHYDSIHQQADSQQQQQQQLQKQPLKDSTNTSPSAKYQKLNNNEDSRGGQQEPESTQQDYESKNQQQQGSRSLQCLETLAQKAGIHDITPDDCKYDVANTLLNLVDRGQHEIVSHIQRNSMSDIKTEQQMVDANTQAQQAQQQQQLQQVAMQQQEQQALVPAQSPQHLQQVTVGASGAQCVQATTSMGPPQHVSMHQQQQSQGQVMQQQQQQQQAQAGGQVLTAQSGNATITTMSPLQQTQATHPQQINPADWSHGRAVQVIPQPTTYLPQLYNTSGQLLMPNNIALHPSINPQQIQVIAKPFQGNQLPHMLAAPQGKQVIQGSQAATFGGYTTIPTIPTTQNQQTLVFSQLGVISSQPNILPNHSGQGNGQVNQQKQQEMHKVMGGQKVMQKVTSGTGQVQQQQQGQCVQVSQAMIGSQPTAQIISSLQSGGQPMQFTTTPWQLNGIPQVWTTNGLQSQTLLAAPNQIFIRGPQPDGSAGPAMFIQQSPQATTIQTQQNPAMATQGTVQQISKQRPANENIQPKQTTNRPLNILPSNAANIRPASSVSTQTIGAQTPASMGGKPGAKIRGKTPQIRTSPAPKADAANQTQQIKTYSNVPQHHLVQNKMLVMNTSTGMTTMTPGSPMTADKAQQLANQQNKVQQAQQQQAQQQQQSQAVLMQQQQQAMQQQQAALQQMQFQQGQQTQHIQPKPMMMQTIQGMQQQQIQMTNDRPIMPVVSMSAQGQQVQQSIQQAMPMQRGMSLQSNLAVTQQMSMQQLHPQLAQMAPPGTIIGQIQAAPTQQAPMQQQVQAPAPTQMQLQQSAPQQTVAMSQTPQQVPLPATMSVIKPEPSTTVEATTNISAADSATQNVITTTTGSSDPVKEVSADASSSQNENKELPLNETKQVPPNGVESTGIQPVPIPGTVPTQPSTTTASGTENGLPVAATAEEVKERCPPKAMVKPQVLTHVIEDFVIHESSDPFPVTKSSLLSDLKPIQSTNDKDYDEPPRKKAAMSPTVGLSSKGELAKCEACGTVDLKAKFKKNKRFCSVACSKSGKYKSDEKKKWDKEEGMEVDTESGASGAESTLSPNNNNTNNIEENTTPKVDPLKWSVQEVFDFINNLPGCSDYAEDFLIQEIDGQALMLLKADHLMSAMAMKLGPALKIVAKIDDMRVDKEPPKQN